MPGLGLGPPPTDGLTTMLADSAHAFLKTRHDMGARVRSLRGDKHGFDLRLWREMAELGWLSLQVPQDRGGAGLEAEHAALLARIFGTVLLNEPFVAAGLLPINLLSRLPPCESVDALLEKLIAGEAIAGLAWQEQLGQIDFDQASLTLRRVNCGFAADGNKYFVPWAAAANTLLVTGKLDGTFTVAAVATDSGGITISSSTLIDGTPAGDISFSGAPVQILAVGEPAASAIRLAGLEATMALAAELVGLSSAALEITADYMRIRVQFGKPIGAFQALQHRMADYYNQIRLAEASVRAAARALTAHPETASIAVSAAKARSSETAQLVTSGAIQLHGAIGYTDEHNIGLYLKGALRRNAWLGTASRHRARAITMLRPQPKEGVA